MRRGLSVLRALMTVIAVVLIAGVAFAQSRTTGEIFGTISDAAGEGVGNANVIAIGPQGARTATTDASGDYRLEFLPPGEYSITASAEGLQAVTMQGVIVRLDSRTAGNIQLQPMAEVEETITVTADAPTVDTNSTATSTNITSDLLGKVPTGRSVGAVLDLAPGVTDGGGTGSGNPSISGASGLENSYIVDGVNITNTGYGSIGSYSIRYGSLGSGVNFDFIDTVQVKSGGFEAEYGQALGGIVNVITKRGTNELHGSVFGYYSPHFLEGDRRKVFLDVGAVDVTRTEGIDLGVQVGGPIIKDKLFFYGAVNPQRTVVAREASATLPLAGLGEVTTTRQREAYAGKLTWNIVPNHRLELSAFGDPGRSGLGPQSGGDLRSDSTSRFSELEFGGHNQVLRYEGIVTEWLSLEAQVAHSQNSFAQTFPSENDVRQIIDFSGGGVDILGGIGFHEREQVSENTTYSLKATNYFNALGRHEVKYGLAFEDIEFSNETGRTGPFVTFQDPATGEIFQSTTGVTVFRELADDGTTVVDRVVRGLLSQPRAETRSQYTSVFLQDKWSPIDTVTLSLGLRVEEQALIGAANSDLDGDGITDAAKKHTFKAKDNLAPRLGAAWDFTGRGRGKVYGHFGRFYEKIPNDIAVRLLSQETSLGIDYIDANGDGQLTFDEQIPEGTVPINGVTEHFELIGHEPSGVEHGTKSQFQDEWVLGAEYELFPRWNVGLRWIHREIGRVLEDYQLTPNEMIITSADVYGGVPFFTEYVIGNPGTSLNDTCPPEHPNCWVDPVRQYDALEFTVEKRFADNWQLLGSYRLSRLFGNYQGLFRSDNGQSDPNITSLFDFPNNTSYTQAELDALCDNLYDPGTDATNNTACKNRERLALLPGEMAGQGKSGLLNTDRTHIVQVAGSYTAPVGLTVGAVARYETGTPITALRAHPNPFYGNAGELPQGTRGDEGRTPDRFTLDLHADYGFPIPRRPNLRGVVVVDVLNALNSQEVFSVDTDSDFAPGDPNPDFLKAVSYQAPRVVRLGVKLEF